MNKTKFTSLTASLVLATTFTYSCDSKDKFTDSRDGKKYKTVTIGSQTWMAENLNFAAEGSTCYETKPENCEIYGRLYNWETAMKSCPNGWHLPSNNEYNALFNTVGGVTEGNKLKAKSGWDDYDGKPGNGTDDFGFKALPGGQSYYNGSTAYFGGVGSSGDWWSANEDNIRVYEQTYAYFWTMSKSPVYVNGGSSLKSDLKSVRCVLDKPAPVAASSGSGGKIMYVNDVKGLNMRSEPSTDGAELGTLFYGAKVQVLEKSSTPVKIGDVTDYWYKTDANSWVFGGFLSEKPPEEGTLTDSRDGKVYRKVKIGKQTWMAENLNYETKGSLCYKHEPDSCAKYGRLYDWTAAKKTCPAGWHLPTEKEWDTFMNSVGGRKSTSTIKKLMSSKGWCGGDCGGTDNYGFSALPGGEANGGSFDNASWGGYWWSATVEVCEEVCEEECADVCAGVPDCIVIPFIYGSNNYVNRHCRDIESDQLASVRCIQN